MSDLDLFNTKEGEQLKTTDQKYQIACKILSEIIAVECGHYPIEEIADRKHELLLKAETLLNNGYVEMK